MKVRNNTNGDLPLTFVDGHTIHLSRGEISRELEEAEMIDPFFAKALHNRRVVQYTEPVKQEEPKPAPEPEPEPEPIAVPEPEEEEQEVEQEEAPKKKGSKKGSKKTIRRGRSEE